MSDIYTEYYYLTGYSCNQPKGKYEIATFRLSRLNSPKKCRGDYLTQNEVFALDQKLQYISPAYLQNNAIEIEVIMTNDGEEKYFRILRNRPNVINKEPLINNNEYKVKYTFFGTEFQIANYFHQFGADAVIINPQALHDEQKKWYENASKAYN